ncbi:hypothetical protein D1818_15160 [Aquimarina sp. BL5]|uniref:tail fiber protein n=1 Tax=Aquimarina sp. BL5 TaxID=1714860 RepID=UPI000E5322D5|nr:tail fiber protein [Aquimarina sp. BL5]AXT52113.1 hypothetical protein D1818_15160 [Aquimarina sp. BL5]RKN10769.1 hypothetical protein D7036_01825 [Aquimarina sp. BL5]
MKKSILFTGIAMILAIPSFAQWNPNDDNATTGNVTAQNPNNPEAVNMLSWYNDVARIRIGGMGNGADNGFLIQGPGNKDLFKLSGNGNINVYGNNITQNITGTPSAWYYLIQSNGKNSGFWANSGNPALYLRNTSGSLNTVIRPDGDSYLLGGNLGIGTNSPAANLHVVGDGIRASNFSLESINDLTNDSPWYGLGRSNYASLSSDNIKTSVQLAGYYGLLFKTAAGSLGIHQNGNVGIGATNPGSKLHISNGSSGGTTHGYSDLTIEDNDNPMINLLSPNNKTGFYGFSDTEDNYVGGMQYVHATNSMIFRVNDHLNDMTIDQSGNVGIGTVNPSAKLQVEGQTKVGKWGILTLDWTNEPNWGGSSNKWAGYIGFNSSRNDEDPKDHYKGTNKYTSKGVFEGSNYGFRWLYRNHNNYDSDAQHQLTEYMRLTNDGNLGIGTTNPDAKLTVKGNIHTQEVKVDLNGAVAPDYVFLEDYNLKSINEVEAYINDQGHLPNIPSAAEMEQNGIELKQMNLNLLEKIEELTLYTIAQEKEIKETNNNLLASDSRLQTLEIKNNELENRLEKLEKLITNK